MVTINTNQSNSTLSLLNSGTSATSSSANQPAVTVTGLGSSFDTGSIVNSLIQVERIPILSIQNKQNQILEKIKATTELEQNLTDLQALVSKFRVADNFNTKTATITNLGAQTTNVADVTVDSTAVAGTHTLNVTQLATNAQEVTTTGFASQYTSLNGSGSYTFNLAGGSSVGVTVTASDSLISIANKINAASAGVTASVINDGSANPYKLLVTSNDTGATNDVTIVESGTPTLPFSFNKLQAAQNASFTIDGVSFSKASNHVTDALQGVTMDLNVASNATLAITSDTTAIKANVQDFVTQYNTLADFIKKHTAYTPGWAPGALFGDSVIKSVQAAMSSVISGEVPGTFSSYRSLSSIGIKSDNDGKLSVNDAELTTALDTDPTGVMNVFVASGQSSDTSKLDYTSHNHKTTGGIYEVNVDASGTVTMRQQGTTTWNATDSSVTNYYSGKAGTPEEGLIVYVVPGQNNFTATVNASRGVFDNLTSTISNLLDKTSGSVYLKNQGLTKQVNNYDDEIRKIEDRVAVKSNQIRAKFSALEGLLSQFDSQKKFLTSQLASLGK